MQRAIMFNDCMAMDITEWHKGGRKVMILHMIDEFSRLSVAKFIPDKKPETVMNTMFVNWYCVFGNPKQVIHDKGGELLNQKMANLLNVMGIRVLSSPSYSPFANRIIKRHNRILKQTMEKMKSEYPMKEWDNIANEMILTHSVFAKNATLYSDGNSAFMKTFGKDASQSR